MRLQRKFFNRPAEIVAKDLLGKKIVRFMPDGREISGVIAETEAYTGVEDKASHSYGGRRTKRNEVMYGFAGHIYIYFTYGMHWMLNFITGDKGSPEGVLIRGVDKVNGPGRVTKYFHLDKDFYGEDLTKSKRIWVEDISLKIKGSDIKKTPRIGVNYAKEWKNKKLRFLVESTLLLKKSPKEA